jgi:8-oxo-dGTP diphosphatase
MTSNKQSAFETVTAKNSEGYQTPIGLTADPVILTIVDNQLSVLLVKREQAPDKNKFAFPGGFVGSDEAAEQTVSRKLYEKTGLKAEASYIEQLATYSDPNRDPRGWLPTVAYLALVPAQLLPESSQGEWLPVNQLNESALAFDHHLILQAAITRLKNKLWYSNVAVGLLDKKFTLAEARRVYQLITNKEYDPANFARDLNRSGLIKEVAGKRSSGAGRPAQLYSFCSQKLTWK